MFRISSEPIEGPLLQAGQSSGAVVTFEGKVRNANFGRVVLRLEYEAYDDLAVQVGNRILVEALRRFEIQNAGCAHRTGVLEIGETAIRVEVESSHRREAFQACEWIVDEVKKTVPIWKKEHYAEGDSGWIGVQGPAISEETFYSRQTILPEVLESGQEHLRNAKVLVIGAGGLGSSALLYLAAAGVGMLGICEADVLDASNLHRQTIFDSRDLGLPKVRLAADRLRAHNPFITVVEHPLSFCSSNAVELCSKYDVILECTDNFESKFLANEAAVRLGKTLVYGSVYQHEGQVFVVEPNGPCLRCIWTDAPKSGCVGNCAEVGVLGYVPGAIGTLQAAEAIKRVLELPNETFGVLFLVDLNGLNIFRVKISKDPQCPTCGQGQDKKGPWWEVNAQSLDDLNEYTTVDIREANELQREPFPIKADFWAPMSATSPEEFLKIAPGKLLLICRSGGRTAKMASAIAELGEQRVYSLTGGLGTLLRLAK